MRRRPTIVLADDHPSFTAVVVESLGSGYDIVGAVHDHASLAEEVRRLRPDLVIFDVEMPMLDGLLAAMRIREAVPSARLMFLAIGSETAAEAVKIAGLGVVVKACGQAEIAAAVGKLFRGEVDPRFPVDDRCESDRQEAYLTSREREVVQLLAEGRPMKQVANLLNVSTRTIAFHKYGVMRKLGLNSSAELIRLAVSQGLVA